MAAFQTTSVSGRCQNDSDTKDPANNVKSVERSACAAQVYLIEVSFNMLQDEAEREHLLNLPTSFHLDPEDVDRLKTAARSVLKESKVFQRLLNDLQLGSRKK